MCKYCKHVKTGNDYKDLLQLPVSFKIGSLESEKDSGDIGIDIGIDGNKLITWALIGDECIQVAKLSIKYCPVCGQNLSELLSS